MHALAHLIPESNVLSLPAVRSLVDTGLKSRALEAAYSQDGNFVGAFSVDSDKVPSWAARIARYNRDEFHHDTPGRYKLLSDLPEDVLPRNADLGSRCLNYSHALKLWSVKKQGPKPYTEQQDYGSCVDASFAALATSLLGYRAANPLPGPPAINEEFIYAAAWWLYAFRGYCSDGWDGFSLATQAKRHGIMLRRSYSSGSSTVDLTDDDDDENLMARTYCRSGPPQWMQEIALRDHPLEDGAVVEFDGNVQGMMDVLAAGGCLHFGGTNTSGGSTPYTIGRVGGHEQTCYGGDGSEEFRKFSRDVIGRPLADSDFAIVNDQTWGQGFSGECAAKYWPAFWFEQPEGAWVWRASDLLKYFEGDILAWLPRIKGIPSSVPTPPPTPTPTPTPTPGGGVIIGGELSLSGPITIPAGEVRRYIVVPKPEV